MLGRYTHPTSRTRAIARVRWLATFLDNAVQIPGTKVRVGFDALVGLVPIAGDIITAACSLYIVLEAIKLGARAGTVAKMLGNIALDFVIGEIPALGDIVDVFFKANIRNLALLESEVLGGEPVRVVMRTDGTVVTPGAKPDPAASPAPEHAPLGSPRRRVPNTAQ